MPEMKGVQQIRAESWRKIRCACVCVYVGG